jgi:hypothetical protein
MWADIAGAGAAPMRQRRYINGRANDKIRGYLLQHRVRAFVLNNGAS